MVRAGVDGYAGRRCNINPVMRKQVDPKQLEKTVRELKKRAAAHRDYIEGHETRTRVLLIDPLLRALGWNLENPDEVQLEFKLSTGKPDYALMKDGQPIAVIEAKRLGTRLETQNPGQVIKYTDDRKFSQRQVVAFTNGAVWTFFRASKNWDAETVDLSSIQTFETAFDLVNCLSAYGFDDPKPRPDPPKPEGLVPLPNADWGMNPARLWFEDGSNRPVSSWGKVYAEVSRYVVDRGLVKARDYPVVLSRRKPPKKCAMNISPVHPHGVEFYSRVKVREGIWLDNGLGSNKARWDYSVRMLRRFGIDPGSVQIEYATITIDSSKPPPMPLNKGRAR